MSAAPKAHALTDAQTRKKRLAKIHAGKRALGLSDGEYRCLLVVASMDANQMGGLDSAANMSEAQHLAVLAEMRKRGFKLERRAAAAKRWPGEPKDCDSRPMLGKVRALLADAKRPWSYAHALAKRMSKVARVEWLDDSQLHKLVAALEMDARRRNSHD